MPLDYDQEECYKVSYLPLLALRNNFTAELDLEKLRNLF